MTILPPVEDPSFLVSTEAVVGETTSQYWDVVEFEVEIDDERHYAVIRIGVKLAFAEYYNMRPLYLIIRPQDILNVRVLRQQEAHPDIQRGLWPSSFERIMPNTGTVVINISKKPPSLVLGPSDGMTPPFDRTKSALRLFEEMARSDNLKIVVRRHDFEDYQLHTLRHDLRTFELYPDELTQPCYKGLKVISEHWGLAVNDSPTSSDERASSRSPSPVPGGRCKSFCSYSLHFPTHTNARLARALHATKKRKRAVVDDGSPSGDDLHPGIADNLQQLEERLTQKMNAQCEEKVQRMLAESKDAFLSEVDARLNARLAEIRADIANKPYNLRGGRVADLDRELELKIEARLPSLKDELREAVCEDVKARLISALGHGSSAS